MAIGDKVRAEHERKEEAALNEQGKLSARQIKEAIGRGLSLRDARELAESGIRFEEILEIADAQAATLKQAQSGQDMAPLMEQFAAVTEKAISSARNRRPESYNGDVPHKGISIYNPDGLANPAPPLKCKVFEGSWNADAEKAVPYWEMEGCMDGLGPNSKLEVLLANRLQPGEFRVRNHDGDEGLVRVVAKKSEATGEVTQLVIAYPHAWVTKTSKGRLKPSLLRVFCDIYGADGEKPEQLWKWLRAQEMVAA